MKPRVAPAYSSTRGHGWGVQYLEDGIGRLSWAPSWEVAMRRANRLAWKQARTTVERGEVA